MNFFDSYSPTRRFERRYAEYLISRFQSIALPGGVRINLQQELVPVRGLQEVLVSPVGSPTELAQPLLLIGEPGSGKTTALAHIALAHARGLLAGGAQVGDPAAHIPIFIPARELNPLDLPHLGDLSRLLLGDVLAAQCPPGYFRDAVSTGRAVVLVDDLDALTPAAGETLRQELGNARIIAASLSPQAGFFEFPMPLLRDNDIQAFARQWNADKAPGFLASIKTSKVPRALTANRMMLGLLARVWRPDQPLPTHRTPLFDAYANTVLKDAGDTARVLEEAALARLRGQATSNGTTAQSRGFLRAGKNHAAEFVHDLWASYFAARALRRLDDQSALFALPPDRRWQEALVFLGGWGDATDLVGTLTGRGDWSLAGRLLANARDVRPEVGQTVTQELIRLAWDGDANAKAALFEMGSEAAVDQLGARLRSKETDERIRAVEVLGQLRLDKCVDYLLPQLRDPNPEMRDQVVHALGLALTDRVVDPLLVALRGDGRTGKAEIRRRAGAAQALGAIGSDRAVPALIVDMQFGEPEVRAAAAQALKRIPNPLMLEPLQGIAESGDDQARRDAADILAVLKR